MKRCRGSQRCKHVFICLSLMTLARFFTRWIEIPRTTRATSDRLLSMIARTVQICDEREEVRVRQLTATTKQLTLCTITVISAHTVMCNYYGRPLCNRERPLYFASSFFFSIHSFSAVSAPIFSQLGHTT